jgi:hypothetical protein
MIIKSWKPGSLQAVLEATAKAQRAQRGRKVKRYRNWRE